MQSQTSLFELARQALIRGAAPFGANRAEQYLRDGLPEEFRRPLDFLFQSKLDDADRRVVERVEALRAAFALRPETFHVFTAEDAREPREALRLATRSSVTQFWGTFLYLCARGFGADTILELGSCVGISGSYLASAPQCRQMISVERSEDVSRVARQHIQSVFPQAQAVNARIDDVLPDVLNRFENSIQLYYIDANHRFEPTIRYFETAIPHLRRGALVIFDDIHWSKEMWEAWLLLRAHAGFSHTVDVGRFGLCVWQGDTVRPKIYNLAKYAGWLKKYEPR